jgi:hypothetical protein
MVQFGDCYELAPTSILVSVFSPWALFCSTAVASGPFSLSCFILSLAEVCSWALSTPGCPESIVEDPSLGIHYLRYRPGAAAVFGEAGPSGFPVLGLFCPTGG